MPQFEQYPDETDADFKKRMDGNMKRKKYDPNKNFNTTIKMRMGEIASETAGMPKYKKKKKIKLKTGKTETPYVGQKVIDGVKYNVNAEGTPVSSIVPVEKKPKTPWEHYKKRLKKGGYQAFKNEKSYNMAMTKFKKKHGPGGAHHKDDER